MVAMSIFVIGITPQAIRHSFNAATALPPSIAGVISSSSRDTASRSVAYSYYTAFVIELHSRRCYVLGSTRQPDDAFVVQAFRGLTGDSEVFRTGRFLICDRDPKWTARRRPCSGRSVFVWFALQRLRPTATRTQSASSGRSRRNASSESYRWVSGTSGTSYGSSWTTTRGAKSPGHRERAHRAATPSTKESSRSPTQRVGGVLSYYYRSAE
jgi:hypothetical protein